MSIAENLKRVQDQIAATGKPVELIAVSKTQSVDALRDAVAAGQRAFGENYVQELVSKAETLADLNLDWHFIGHLQRNKVNILLPHISTIHSIDSMRLAETIATRTTKPVAGFIEVNLGGEPGKDGIEPEEIEPLLRVCSDFTLLEIKGLMCIPPLTYNISEQQHYFLTLSVMQKNANNAGAYRQPLTELSMGMSHDYLMAIQCGATCVRVGTAIFGER